MAFPKTDGQFYSVPEINEIINGLEHIDTDVDEKIALINQKIGDLAELETDAKTSLTDAVNEIHNDVNELQEEVTATQITETATGAIASFSDGADGQKLKTLVCTINPVQTGTGDPSPENVRPITGHTKVDVTRTGKNLVDISGFATEYPTACTYSNDTLSVSSPVAAMYSTGISVKIPASSILNCNIVEGTASDVRIILVYADGTIQNLYSTSFPFTTLNREVVAIRFNWSSAGSFTVSNFQAEIGETASTYEPYSGQSVTYQLGDTVYGGTLTINDDGSGTIVSTMAMVDMGMLNYIYNTSSLIGVPCFYINITDIKRGSSKNFSSEYANKTYRDEINGNNQMAIGNNADANYIVFRNDAYSDPIVFKSAMSGVQLLYELAEPVTINLTAQEVIETLKGENNIHHDGNGNTTVEYIANSELYIDKLKTEITDLKTQIAPIETGTTASQAYTTGQYFWLNGQFCKAKTSIASGATFTLNTNYEVTTVANELYTSLQ